jgi:hypothetical protein
MFLRVLSRGFIRLRWIRKRVCPLADSGDQIITWILHEPEAFICKAFKAEAIVNYASALITQQMEASGSPEG